MYIAADIGGTKMRIAGSDDLKFFSDPIILNTPANYKDGIMVFVEAASKIATGSKIDTIIAGVPGVVSRDRRTLVTAPHLPLWKGSSMAQDIESILKVPVHLENDTALVGLGEVVAGAATGASIVAYITVSTGVNGVRIIDGQIDKADQGFEVGGQYLFTNPYPRSLEDLVSGSAIGERYGKAARDIEKDSPIWEELSVLFAYGLHNTILHWSPDRVVLGGSMFNEIGISIERVRFHLDDIMRKFPELPHIVHSSLGDLGGIHGGLARLKQLLA